MEYNVASARMDSPAFDSSDGDFIARISDSNPRWFTLHISSDAPHRVMTIKDEETEYYKFANNEERFYNVKDVVMWVANNDEFKIKLDYLTLKDTIQIKSILNEGNSGIL